MELNKCRITVTLGNLIEVIREQKGKFDTGKIEFYPNMLYDDLEKATMKTLSITEKEAEEKLKLFTDNISENLLLGYYENKNLIFNIRADEETKDFIVGTADDEILEILEVIYDERLGNYLIEYKLDSCFELKVYDTELEELIADYVR